jgi:myo-inositol catabolism protein IolC
MSQRVPHGVHLALQYFDACVVAAWQHRSSMQEQLAEAYAREERARAWMLAIVEEARPHIDADVSECAILVELGWGAEEVAACVQVCTLIAEGRVPCADVCDA